MGIALSEETLRLVDGKNYAVLATVNPDGSPADLRYMGFRCGRAALLGGDGGQHV
jgi:hypothetical protein